MPKVVRALASPLANVEEQDHKSFRLAMRCVWHEQRAILPRWQALSKRFPVCGYQNCSAKYARSVTLRSSRRSLKLTGASCFLCFLSRRPRVEIFMASKSHHAGFAIALSIALGSCRCVMAGHIPNGLKLKLVIEHAAGSDSARQRNSVPCNRPAEHEQQTNKLKAQS